MKNKIILVLLFCRASFFSVAQSKTESFQLALPDMKAFNSEYNSIRVIDIRRDTTDFGIVQKGGFNRKEKVIVETPLASQLSALVSYLIDSSAKNREMVLLLRQFSFAEVTGGMSEKGYFQFRAVLFANDNGQYRKINRIDTVVVVSSMDVTKKMFRLGSKTVTNFIAFNLTEEPTNDINISLNELSLIDSFEKRKLPLYNVASLAEGIYYNFQSFVSQQPDEAIKSVEFLKNGKVKRILYKDKNGREQELDYRLIYAFIHNAKAHISGEFTYYPLEKRGDDFYFTGKVLNAKSGDVATAAFFFGIMGGLMASSATAVFEMKIDHLTGGFIRVKEVEK